MRIAHLITTISRGGAELQLLLLAQEQVKRGHLVTVFPLKGSLDLAERLRSVGVSVDLTLHDRGIVVQIILANMRLKHTDFDVVHTHLPQAELIAASTWHKNVICSRHYGGRFFPRGSSSISRILSNYATRNVRTVIAISETVGAMLQREGEISRNRRVVVVNYGFSNSRFDPADTASLIHSTDSNTLHSQVFSCFARLSPEKNLIFLLRAWASVLKEEPSWSLKIFGEGSQFFDLTQECDKLNLDSKEILAGRTENVKFEMSRSSALILPSQFEGFGMVLLEAMSVGIPIVASDIPICREVLGSDGAGIFFPIEDPNSLSEVLLHLKDHVSANFKEEQRKRLEKYDIKLTVDKVEQIYLG
jgi:glycosyltransferase involved in cell wall biosynthesis